MEIQVQIEKNRIYTTKNYLLFLDIVKKKIIKKKTISLKYFEDSFENIILVNFIDD